MTQFESKSSPRETPAPLHPVNTPRKSSEQELDSLLRENGKKAMKLLRRVKRELAKIEGAQHLPKTDKVRIQVFLEGKQKEYQEALIRYATLQNIERSSAISELTTLKSDLETLSLGESSIEITTTPLNPIVPTEKKRKQLKNPPESRRNMNIHEKVEFSKDNLQWWVDKNPPIESPEIQDKIEKILTDNGTDSTKVYTEIISLQSIIQTFEDGAFGRNSRLALESYLLRKKTEKKRVPEDKTLRRIPVSPTLLTSDSEARRIEMQNIPEPEEITLTIEQLEKKLEVLSKDLDERLYFWSHATADASGVMFASDLVNKHNRIIYEKESLLESIDTYKKYRILAEKNGSDFGKYDLRGISTIERRVAEYFRGTGSIPNPHFKDQIQAEELLKNIIDSEKSGLFPEFPSRAEILSKLNKNTKKLLTTTLEKKEKAGFSFDESLGQLLSNPRFSSEWGTVRDAALNEYNVAMQAAIKKVIGLGVKGEKLRALNALINMYGAEGWWNLTDAQKNQLFAFGNQALAIAAGVAGAVLVGTGVGAVGGAPLLALSGAALFGGAITTGAKIGLDQYVPKASEVGTEYAINTGTFAVGGALAGTTQKILAQGTKGGKVGIGTLATVGAIESAGNVSIGMFLDGIHAIRSGSSLNVAESAKVNLTFALLPIFTHGAFSIARKTLARDTYSGLQKAKELEKRGAKQEAEKVIGDVMKHVKEEQRILSKIELDALRAVDGFIPEGAVISTRTSFVLPDKPIRKKPRVVIRTAAEIKEERRIAHANEMLRFIDAINENASVQSRAKTGKPIQVTEIYKGTGRNGVQGTSNKLSEIVDQRIQRPSPFKVVVEESNKPFPSQRVRKRKPGDIPPTHASEAVIIDI